ncbi:TPA: hypothetical protein ACH3X3_006126 [Trebouxia sp. C0006]
MSEPDADRGAHMYADHGLPVKQPTDQKDVKADAINQPAAREAVGTTIAQACPGRLSPRPVWTVQVEGRSEATVK